MDHCPCFISRFLTRTIVVTLLRVAEHKLFNGNNETIHRRSKQRFFHYLLTVVLRCHTNLIKLLIGYSVQAVCAKASR
jgi:hypothetical protein